VTQPDAGATHGDFVTHGNALYWHVGPCSTERRGQNVTTPTWMLLGFAAWTIVLLASTIGMYRWFHILAGRAAVNGFSADQPEGSDWYKRSMRAHANCIENLPVFGAIVLALHVSAAGGAVADYASIGVLIARVMQSLVHVCLPQTSSVVAVRFSFLLVQLVCFFILIVIVVRYAALIA
jgi:hypothetical protein